jgi:uroporphyrinogen decarboxylase
MSWTPRERVLAALAHEEADRVPIDLGGAEFTSIIYPAYEKLKAYLGMDHETKMMSRLHSVVHPHEDILRMFGVDTRNVFPGSYQGGHQVDVDDNCFIDLFDVTWNRTVDTDDCHFLHTDGPFYNMKPSVEAVEAFDWPDPDNPGIVEGLRERVDEIKALGDYFVCHYLPGGFVHRGYAMRGFEAYLKDIYKNREFLLSLIDHLTDFWVRVAHNTISAVGPENVDGVFFGEDLGTQDGCMFDPDSIYAQYFKPRHRRMVEAVKSMGDIKVCYHCCGSAYQFIDHLIDIGVDALNPVQVTAKNMEPERLKADFGDRITFWGGINTQQILPFGTPEEVTAEVHRIINILGRNGGYILNAIHNIQPEVPPENIVAMFEAGLNHPFKKAA